MALPLPKKSGSRPSTLKLCDNLCNKPATVECPSCNMENFCPSCDDILHRRLPGHIRRPLANAITTPSSAAPNAAAPSASGSSNGDLFNFSSTPFFASLPSIPQSTAASSTTAATSSTSTTNTGTPATASTAVPVRLATASSASPMGASTPSIGAVTTAATPAVPVPVPAANPSVAPRPVVSAPLTAMPVYNAAPVTQVPPSARPVKTGVATMAEATKQTDVPIDFNLSRDFQQRLVGSNAVGVGGGPKGYRPAAPGGLAIGHSDRQTVRERINEQTWNALDERAERGAFSARAIYAELADAPPAAGGGGGGGAHPPSPWPLTHIPHTPSGVMLPSPPTYQHELFNSARWDTNTGAIHTPGPAFVEPVTEAYVLALMKHFRAGGRMAISHIHALLRSATHMLKAHDTVVVVPRMSKITVVGDIHGQLDDLFYIFDKNGLPSISNPYLFNGDWVDRSTNGSEVVLILFAYKLLFPHHIFLNRGNHEVKCGLHDDTKKGFRREIMAKYNSAVTYELFCEAFAALPMATIIQDSIFVVHGGPPFSSSLADIRRMPNSLRWSLVASDRPGQPKWPQAFIEMLWNDPIDHDGLEESDRGAGVMWGPDQTRLFLATNKLSLLVRSHQQVHDGYVEHKTHDNKLITVFSASNYCGSCGNQASFVIFPSGAPHTVCTFYAKDKGGFSPHRAHRNDVIERDIIRQLLILIAEYRSDLFKEFQKTDPRRTGLITLAELEAGLQNALRLRTVPFLFYAEGLGFPHAKFVVKRDTPVNYPRWLGRFRLVHRVFSQGKVPLSMEEEAKSSGKESTPDDRSIEEQSAEARQDMEEYEKQDKDNEVVDWVYLHRHQLEQWFFQFDSDHSGHISLQEFETGIKALNSIMPKPLTEKERGQIHTAFTMMEENKKKYGEMFGGFKYVGIRIPKKKLPPAVSPLPPTPAPPAAGVASPAVAGQPTPVPVPTGAVAAAPARPPSAAPAKV